MWRVIGPERGSSTASMDIGLGFDDSDFEQKQKTTAGTKTSYNAKVCNPLWFDCEEGSDPANYTHQLKFSADYHFYQSNYETAAEKYRTLLDLIPETNQPMRQDVQESLCRSYTKLCRHSESTEIAYRMVKTMKNEDDARQRQSLLLLSQSCKEARDWTGCVSALEELASRQSNFAQFWLELGRAYRQSVQDRGDNEQYKAQVLTCYVRAKMLLQSVLATVGQIARERHGAMICKIEKDIQELEVAQQLVEEATEVIRADLEQNSTEGEGNEKHGDADEVAAFSSDAFRKRWFSWTDKYNETT